MENKEQIEIEKSSIQRFIMYILFAYTITFILVLAIQHLGDFRRDLYNHNFMYYSPLTSSRYETDLPSVKYAGQIINSDSYGEPISYFNDVPESDYSYSQKLKGTYLPSMFTQLLGIQVILTIVFTAIIYIVQSFNKKYKIKFT